MGNPDIFIVGYLKRMEDGHDIALCPICMGQLFEFNPNTDIVLRSESVTEFLEGLVCEECGEYIFFPSKPPQEDKLATFREFIETLDL